MRAGIWSHYRATTPIEQTGRVASSSFDPGGEQCAPRTSETTDQHTVHCCSHCHVTTTATYFESPCLRLRRSTTSHDIYHLIYHLYHIDIYDTTTTAP